MYRDPIKRADWIAAYESNPKRIAKKQAYRKTPKGRHGLRRGSRRAELRKFQISEPEYQAMLRKQNGVCAICHEPPNGTSLCVDHCHVTGKRRGLLCHACNVGIGNFLDDPNRLRAAMVYLEERQ